MKTRTTHHAPRNYAKGFLVLLFLVFATVSAAQNKVVIIPMAGDDLRTVYEVGDTGPAGGVVFYVTDGGSHGLEAAPTDHDSSVGWGCVGVLVQGINAIIDAATPDSNSGAHNTQKILDAGCASSFAVGLANENTKWYLPNKEELNLLFQQKDAVGGFLSEFYWSSTQNSADDAWVKSFGNTGNHGSTSKSITYRVRVIRAF